MLRYLGLVYGNLLISPESNIIKPGGAVEENACKIGFKAISRDMTDYPPLEGCDLLRNPKLSSPC